jgi:hypothetical protein
MIQMARSLVCVYYAFYHYFREHSSYSETIKVNCKTASGRSFRKRSKRRYCCKRERYMCVIVSENLLMGQDVEAEDSDIDDPDPV